MATREPPPRRSGPRTRRRQEQQPANGGDLSSSPDFTTAPILPRRGPCAHAHPRGGWAAVILPCQIQCQITPTNADHRCHDAEARTAYPLALAIPRPTRTTTRPSLQAGGRRFEPGTPHLLRTLRTHPPAVGGDRCCGAANCTPETNNRPAPLPAEAEPDVCERRHRRVEVEPRRTHSAPRGGTRRRASARPRGCIHLVAPGR